MNDEYATQMSRSFEDELQKIASRKVANAATQTGKSWLLPAIAGGVLTGTAMRAEKDRRLGRRLRVQQR